MHRKIRSDNESEARVMSGVIVVPYDAFWPATFDREVKYIQHVMGSILQRIHHIGSTAIPGIYAKPIVDILAEANSLDAVDATNNAMVDAGYVPHGEFGIWGRRFYKKFNEDGSTVCHLHIYLADSPGTERHLAFRDFMRANPEIALRYSDLKRRLAERHPNDIDAYMQGKDAFVKEIEKTAMRERQSSQNDN